VLKIVTFFGRWLASRRREAVKPARWMGSLFALIVAVSEFTTSSIHVTQRPERRKGGRAYRFCGGFA
jgi:hypothetical protein